MHESSIGEPSEALRADLTRSAHVWISDLEVWRRSPVLSPDEAERVRKLRHPEAQKSFVAGRSLLRFALSHYEGVEPTAWEFSSSKLGRPEISAPGSIARLRFNISHTRGLAACVVTETADCGIDVEELERPLRPLRIAEHSFATEEFDDLADRGADEIRERFFSYWTLKEAYYKARGSGIPFRMTGARFELDSPTRIEFLPADEEDTAASAWQFALVRPTAAHVMAVALRSGADRHFPLRCFSHREASTDPHFVESPFTPLRATATEIPV